MPLSDQCWRRYPDNFVLGLNQNWESHFKEKLQMKMKMKMKMKVFKENSIDIFTRKSFEVYPCESFSIMSNVKIWHNILHFKCIDIQTCLVWFGWVVFLRWLILNWSKVSACVSFYTPGSSAKTHISVWQGKLMGRKKWESYNVGFFSFLGA